MDNQQLILDQLTASTKGIEQIQASVAAMKEDIAQSRIDIAKTKEDIAELKLGMGILTEKVTGIDTRLGNEEAISRIALGSITGGVALTVIKYLFFPS